MGSISRASAVDSAGSMWYEYEPLLNTTHRLRSTPEKKVPYSFPCVHPSFASASHSSHLVYPSYSAYLGGMVDYDYQYRDYKDGSPHYPQYRQTSLSSLPMGVNMRWTK